jgi:flagellin-specific chaperone FliS
MVVATLRIPRAGHQTPEAPSADPAVPLSLALLEGARQCLELARGCIDRGVDPRRHLRWAMTRLRKLPAALVPPGDTEILAILADLTEYMCRELRSVHDATGLATLERMYDLLREIRGAWLTEAVSAGPA